MDRQLCKLALECFGSAAIDYLPDILELFEKYGKSVGTLVKMLRDGTVKFKEEKEKLEFERLKEEAREEVKEIANKQKAPEFADCVIFTCKRHVILREEQKDLLRSFLLREWQDFDACAQSEIIDFLETYMGGDIDVTSVDECQIGDTYLNFTFSDECGTREIRYDEDVKKDMAALIKIFNQVLEDEVFDYYLVTGHEDSWFDEA